MKEQLKLEVSDEIAIGIKGMNKWFGSFHVLRDIDLTVNRGERIVVCGPSGSGKSTLIRCVNALEEHRRGCQQKPRQLLSQQRSVHRKVRFFSYFTSSYCPS